MAYKWGLLALTEWDDPPSIVGVGAPVEPTLSLSSFVPTTSQVLFFSWVAVAWWWLEIDSNYGIMFDFLEEIDMWHLYFSIVQYHFISQNQRSTNCMLSNSSWFQWLLPASCSPLFGEHFPFKLLSLRLSNSTWKLMVGNMIHFLRPLF